MKRYELQYKKKEARYCINDIRLHREACKVGKQEKVSVNMYIQKGWNYYNYFHKGHSENDRDTLYVEQLLKGLNSCKQCI